MIGLNDDDWLEIINKNNLSIHYDTLRKAQQTPFGGYFVREYYKVKNMDNKTQINKAKELLGEQFILKKQLQSEKSEINKFKKEFVKSISIAEELAEIQRAEGFKVEVPEHCYNFVNIVSDYNMIVNISDWHIGYVINNCKGNYYNWEIANERVNQLINEIHKYAKLYNVKKIYVINTGDVIENVSMRKNQSQYCEFNQSEQINHAIKLIFRFLVAISDKCEVEYDSIAGNHDRQNGDLSANLDGDNAETIIRDQIGNLIEIGKIEKITVIDRPHTDNEIIKEINGVLIKARHGHDVIKDDKRQLKADISMDEAFYKLLIKGHEHNFRCVSENKGRYIVSTGCLSGYNDYSTKFGCATNASQTIIILNQDKIELVKDVQLN